MKGIMQISEELEDLILGNETEQQDCKCKWCEDTEGCKGKCEPEKDEVGFWEDEDQQDYINEN